MVIQSRAQAHNVLATCGWPGNASESVPPLKTMYDGVADVVLVGGWAMPNREIARRLATSRVVAFLATANAELSRQFYAEVLQLRLAGDEAFALVFDLNGTMLRIQKIHSVQPVPYTNLGWQTDDISRLVQQLTDRGVQFERYQGLQQDEVAIWTSPAGARVAWFKDPDGNTLSLTEFGVSQQLRLRRPSI